MAVVAWALAVWLVASMEVVELVVQETPCRRGWLNSNFSPNCLDLDP